MTWGELGIKNYKEYLLTPHWQNLRKRLLQNARCWVCGNVSTLCIHHIRYSNLGNERLWKDVYVLCGDCHERVHFWTPLRIRTPLKANFLLLSMGFRKATNFTQKGENSSAIAWFSIIIFLTIITSFVSLVKLLWTSLFKILAIALP
jgi:uncharacterized protein YlaI